MKPKNFGITEDGNRKLKDLSEYLKMSQGEVIRQAIDKYTRFIFPLTFGLTSKYLRNYIIEKNHGKRCVKCGRKRHSKKIRIHHKDFNPYNNIPSNLEVVCSSCHTKIHQTQEPD